MIFKANVQSKLAWSKINQFNYGDEQFKVVNSKKGAIGPRERVELLAVNDSWWVERLQSRRRAKVDMDGATKDW